MMAIERFEDIEAWKKARELTRSIYHLSSTGEFCRDFGLRDQLRRASVSIMSNIAEGFERGGNKEFRQFLSLAKGSAGEVRSQLYVTLVQISGNLFRVCVSTEVDTRPEAIELRLQSPLRKNGTHFKVFGARDQQTDHGIYTLSRIV